MSSIYSPIILLCIFLPIIAILLFVPDGISKRDNIKENVDRFLKEKEKEK